MHAIRFLKALAAIMAAGLVVTNLATPSASMTSPPDETVAIGDFYHLNRCVAARGEDEAILQVEGEYDWPIVGKAPFVRDEDCAAANPKTPYTAPTAMWEPTATGTFAMRLQYGYGVPDVTSQPWAVQVTPGDPSKLTTIRYRCAMSDRSRPATGEVDVSGFPCSLDERGLLRFGLADEPHRGNNRTGRAVADVSGHGYEGPE